MFDKKKITIKIMTFLFVIVHTILYILLYGFGLFQSVENKIIYFMILSCLVFTFLLLIIEKEKSSLYLFVAFVFTSISDTFLVLYDTCYELSVFSFIIVQIFYCIYIHETSYKEKKWLNQLIIRSITIIFAFMMLLLVDKDSRLLVFLTIIYISNLLMNIIFAIHSKKKNYILILGLFLFLLCDICVGCFHIGDVIHLSQNSIFKKIKYFPINLSWFFYYPSQILLAISNIKWKK